MTIQTNSIVYSPNVSFTGEQNFIESPRLRHAIHINPELDTGNSSIVTTTSVLKDSIREMIGTALFVYISLNGVHQAALSIVGTINSVNQVHIALCFALGLTAGIYASQTIGGHLNPAVTFAFWI